VSASSFKDIKLERLRLCQRLLIGALEADPSLNTDDQWQSAMAVVTALVQKEAQKRRGLPQSEIKPRVRVDIEQGSGRIKEVEVMS